jgi:thioesterase domain-containing protein
MIVTVRRTGARPPFFLIHGLYGVLSHTADMGEAVGPEQPFHVIFARGIDGRGSPCASAAEMVALYLEEIRAIAPAGPIFLGGQCAGCLLAVDMANALVAAGGEVGYLLLIDPPPLPFANADDRPPDPTPRSLQQLYDNALDSLRRKTEWTNLPFDLHDPRQMHVAASVAVVTAAAMRGYQPQPYAGPVELIVSANRARVYFQPDLPWQRILTGQRLIHVLPGSHLDMTRVQRAELLRLMRFVLDGAAAPREAGRPLALADD